MLPICYPNISVGTVSIIVHLVTMTLLFLAGSLAARLIKIFTLLRLRNFTCAPLVYEGYTSGRWSPVRLVRMMTYLRPGVTGVIASILLLVPAQLVFDLGVTTSNRCCPRRVITSGICVGNPKASWQMSTFQEIRMLPWDEKQLGTQPIRMGFRRNANGNEYFGYNSRANASLPVVIQGCKSTPHEFLSENNTVISIGWSDKYAHRLAAVNAIISNGTSVSTDVHIFLKTLIGIQIPIRHIGNSGFNITMFESLDEDSNLALRASINRSVKWTKVKVDTRIMKYTMSCEISSLKEKDITDSVLTYRFSEMESKSSNRFNFTLGNRTVPAMLPMTTADITRALLVRKILESSRSQCRGETWEWTTCGTYKISFAVPLITIVAVLLFVWMVMEVSLWRTNFSIDLPVTAHEWFEFAMRSSSANQVLSDYESNLEYKLMDNEKATIQMKSSNSSN